MHTALLFVFLAGFLAGAADANLDCYDCTYTKTGDTVTGTDCEIPSTNATKFLNNTGAYCATKCYTLINVNMYGDRDGFIKRGCFDSTEISLDKCRSGKTDDGYTLRKLKCCSKSLCNSADNINRTGWIFLPVLATVLTLLKTVVRN